MVVKQKSAGLLLIIASLGAVLFMTHHPTIGSDGLESIIAEVQAESTLNRFVHGSMIAFTLVFYIGLTSHSLSIGRDHLLTRCGDTALALATISMVGAALVSGFLTTELAGKFDGKSASDASDFRSMLMLTGAANQVLAKVGTVGYGLAIAFYSVRMLTMPDPARMTGALGFIIGVSICVAIMGGFLKLDVFGMGLVVTIMGMWFIAVAIRMITAR